MPTKSNSSRSARARKTGRARPAKKRVRRIIFKADEWYAGAAMSIGIAGRAKGARPVSAMFMPRVDESVD